MKSYTQLTQEQRYQISAYMKADYNQTEIATMIGVNKSTLSRELKRNRGLRGYRPKQAHHFHQQRQQNKVHCQIKPKTWQWVNQLLKEEWSPVQISHWLLQEQKITISHETIYQYIYEDKRSGGHLYQHLRCQRKRRKRYGHYNTRGLIPDRVSIDVRPAIVEDKRRLGDWELDTVIGKNHQQAIVSLTERKSKFALFAKVTRKTADQVSDAIIHLLSPFKEKVKTMTSDNGKEFSGHKIIANALEADFYFAHPYASWERGLNENTNGLLRQYFPKKSDFTRIKDEDIKVVMNKLNNRPRKSLGFKTPNQVFLGFKQPVALTT